MIFTIQCIKRNKFFLCFVYIALWISLNSSGINQIFSFSIILERFFLILSYLPFAVAILWKIYTDIKCRRKNLVNLMYYIFCVYFLCIETYRFFTGMEVKESLYYFLLLFGSLAIYLQIRDGDFILTKEEYMFNLLAIAIFVIVFHVICSLVLEKYLPNAPININITSGLLVLLFPILSSFMCDRKMSKRQRWLIGFTLVVSLVIVCTTGSRSIFLLSSIIIFTLLISNIILKNVERLLCLFGVCLSVCAIIILMLAINVGDVRYALYRQTNLSFLGLRTNVSEANSEQEAVEETADKEATLEGSVEESIPEESVPEEGEESESLTQIQINQSDNMRTDLIKMGIGQIKVNPWFGTGDILYPYAISEDYIPEQSSHNFVIESIIAFGIIGFLLLIVLFFSILQTTGIFMKGAHSCREIKLSLILTLFFFFGFGFVEPTVYNHLLTLAFAICLAAYRFIIAEEKCKDK